MPRQGERVYGAVGTAIRALWRGLGDGAEDHVDDPQDSLRIPPDRLWRADRQQRIIWDHNVDRFQYAGVGGYIREHML